MTFSLPANQHHEISILTVDESHDSESVVLFTTFITYKYFLFFPMSDPNTRVIPIYQSLPHSYRIFGWEV